jgi:hypothetical protein
MYCKSHIGTPKWQAVGRQSQGSQLAAKRQSQGSKNRAIFSPESDLRRSLRDGVFPFFPFFLSFLSFSHSLVSTLLLPSYALGGTLMPKQTLFVVTEELQRALENLSAVEPRSRLEPFRAFILRWRREGRSYRNIQDILASECKVSVAYETLRRFVKLRSKPRKQQPEPEVPQPASTAKQLTPEERAAQVAYIRSLNKPESQEQPAKPRWNFDADKPRTMHKP